MRNREVKAVDPRFVLKRGESWFRGARVSKRAPAPARKGKRK